jgi:hypothetical protein
MPHYNSCLFTLSKKFDGFAQVSNSGQILDPEGLNADPEPTKLFTSLHDPGSIMISWKTVADSK